MAHSLVFETPTTPSALILSGSRHLGRLRSRMHLIHDPKSSEFKILRHFLRFINLLLLMQCLYIEYCPLHTLEAY